MASQSADALSLHLDAAHPVALANWDARSWQRHRVWITLEAVNQGDAAAQLLPEDLADRDVLLLAAFTVVVGSLLVQGATLPWLVRRIGLPPPDPAEDALQAAENALRVAQSRLNELTARQGIELNQARTQLETSGQELGKLRIQYEAAAREVANTEDKLRLQVQTARLVAEAAARPASKRRLISPAVPSSPRAKARVGARTAVSSISEAPTLVNGSGEVLRAARVVALAACAVAASVPPALSPPTAIRSGSAPSERAEDRAQR